MMKVVAIRECVQHYHDGDSVFMGYNVIRWDGGTQEIDNSTYGPETKLEDLPAIDPEAEAGWKLWCGDISDKINQRSAEIRLTETTLKRVYTLRQGRTVRVVRGRKIPVGTVHKCVSNQMPHGFNQYGSVIHLIDDQGIQNRYVDCYNLECMPTVADVVEECGTDELRCPCCDKMLPVSEFIWSLQDSFGSTRTGNDLCLSCAVAEKLHADRGSELHHVGLAFVAEPCEFTAAVLADCLDEKGDLYATDACTIRERFKVGKKTRKPRKKKETATAV